MRGVQAFLFDLDGVLIDSYAVWHAVLDATAVALGYPTLSPEQFAASWGQGIEEDVRLFYPRHVIPIIEREYERQFPLHLDRLRIAEGVPAVFARIVECRLRSAVITNTPQVVARGLIERAGATPEVIVGGTDVERPKPAPDMVLLACEKLGVAPGESAVVGDSRFDREAAEAAGARFVGIGTPGEHTLGAVGELLSLLEAP